ncbi:spindle pole body component 110 isoform X2 [Prosopis cineraria]|nr:spindle pole body component 110 isoform X2 [Prosopis cineraria]
MVMELLKLSKFKLRLQDLVTEVRELRERERTATEQHQHGIEVFILIQLVVFCRILIFCRLDCDVSEQKQKQKQSEEEHNRKIQDLEAELASVKEERQKLERRVNYLQNDNALLEIRQKELKETIQSLLLSRENFILAYEETTSEMRRSIETKDRKLNILSEKVNAHLLLFDSIEKEVSSIKQIVDSVQSLVTEKEKMVADLRNKMDQISTFEKAFFDNITDSRNKLHKIEDELRRKDKFISELEAKLDARKLSNNISAQIDDLQKTLSVKDVAIQNLISDKEALQYEVGSLRFVLQKIKDTVRNMNKEDKRLFCSILQHNEASGMDMQVEENR